MYSGVNCNAVGDAAVVVGTRLGEIGPNAMMGKFELMGMFIMFPQPFFMLLLRYRPRKCGAKGEVVGSATQRHRRPSDRARCKQARFNGSINQTRS